VSGTEAVLSADENDAATIDLTEGLSIGSISINDVLTTYPIGTFAGFEISNTSLLEQGF
jgi:hypothetical protein